MLDWGWLPVAVVLVGTSIGAATDLWKFRVYNALTIPLTLTGLAYHGAAGGWYALSDSMLGVLFGFMVLLVPYLLGLMGAGDVKLMAGAGAWLGLQMTVYAFVVSALISGVLAVFLILYRGKLGESVLMIRLILYRIAAMGTHFGKDDLVESVSSGPERRLRAIPFGSMVPLGVIGAVVWSVWIQ